MKKKMGFRAFLSSENISAEFGNKILQKLGEFVLSTVYSKKLLCTSNLFSIGRYRSLFIL